jgi:hypothetical protein
MRLAKARGAPKKIIENARRSPSSVTELSWGDMILTSDRTYVPLSAPNSPPEFDKLPAGTEPKSVYHAQAAEKINEAQNVQMQTGAPVDAVGLLSRGQPLVQGIYQSRPS